MLKTISVLFVSFLSFTTLAFAEDERFSFGGDEYAAGNQSTIATPVARDAFAAGFNIHISAPVGGDAHAAGFSVAIDGDVDGDIYAMGNSIVISGRVGQDVTATGTNVSITGTKGVAGNIRLAGANIVISAPITGSATLAGASATIGATINGDVFFGGDKINFTDRAVILGNVTIRSSSDITVPESVASADRVTIEKIENSEIVMGARDIAQRSVQGFWPVWIPVFAGLAIFMLAGVLWLALFPKRSLIAYRVAMAKPWKSLLFGIFGIAAFTGLIPVVAITIIGIPLVPIAIVALVIAGLIGYIAGTWFLATKVLAAFGIDSDTLINRVIALIVGLVAGWLLMIVPFLGWLIQLAFVFLGFGAITLAALARWTDSDFHAAVAEEVNAQLVAAN